MTLDAGEQHFYTNGMEVSDRIWTKRSRVLRGWGPTVMVGGSNGPCQQVLCPEQHAAAKEDELKGKVDSSENKMAIGFSGLSSSFLVVVAVSWMGCRPVAAQAQFECLAVRAPARVGFQLLVGWMGSGHQLSCTTACT